MGRRTLREAGLLPAAAPIEKKQKPCSKEPGVCGRSVTCRLAAAPALQFGVAFRRPLPSLSAASRWRPLPSSSSAASRLAASSLASASAASALARSLAASSRASAVRRCSALWSKSCTSTLTPPSSVIVVMTPALNGAVNTVSIPMTTAPTPAHHKMTRQYIAICSLTALMARPERTPAYHPPPQSMSGHRDRLGAEESSLRRIIPD